MNITITTFINPFSFFCITNTDDSKEHRNIMFQDETKVTQTFANTAKITEFNHGQYVAILWKNKWVRGVISMETQLLVWLVDYGVFLRPNEKNICLDLSLEYRKLPTKVFEASIQGVLPTDKLWSWNIEYFNLNNNMVTTWNPGAINTAHKLLKNAERTYFKPIAILSTQHNDVVIGDLYLKIKGRGVINIKDELKLWPVFLEENTKTYVQNLSELYSNRRRHRSSLLTPELPGFIIPTITSNISFEQYSKVINESPSIDTLIEFETESVSDDGSTVVDELIKDKSAYNISFELFSKIINESPYIDTLIEFETESVTDDGSTAVDKQIKYKSAFNITQQDINKYSERFIALNGRKYNLLDILTNKVRDLNMCNRYQDHDLKSLGRGVSFRSTIHN